MLEIGDDREELWSTRIQVGDGIACCEELGLSAGLEGSVHEGRT